MSNPRSPFPHPATRHEARQNALYWATEAERQIVAGGVMAIGQAAATKASMWADIACAFPEEETVVAVAEDGFAGHYAGSLHTPAAELTPWPAQLPGAGLELVPLNDPTARVPAPVYDVLRAIAIRAVRSSLTRSLRIHPTHDLNPDIVLRFANGEDGSIVVTVES